MIEYRMKVESIQSVDGLEKCKQKHGTGFIQGMVATFVVWGKIGQLDGKIKNLPCLFEVLVRHPRGRWAGKSSGEE